MRTLAAEVRLLVLLTRTVQVPIRSCVSEPTVALSMKVAAVAPGAMSSVLVAALA